MNNYDFINHRRQGKLRIFLRKIIVFLWPFTLKCKLKNGIKIKGRNKKGWGGRGIYIFREDIEPELVLLQKFLKKDSIFIDVGANVGVYSLYAANYIKTGKVIAVEPNIEMAHYLNKNVKLNKLENIIRIRNYGLSNNISVKEFYCNNNRPNSYSLTKVGSPNIISILTFGLHDLMECEGLTRLDYIKIDAENEELNIIKNSVDIIIKYKPIIQLEGKLVDFMFIKDLGYKCLCVENTANILFLNNNIYDLHSDMLIRNGWSLVNEK